MDILKPIYGEVWAASGEKLAPENTKIGSGWILEMMPYQYENFLQNRQDVAITYLLQKGVAEWSGEQEYTANKSVVQYLGHLYIATSTVTNVDPTITASWRKLTVTVGTNGAIPVASGGTGATTAAQARINLGIGSVAPLPLEGVVQQTGDVGAAKLPTGTTAQRPPSPFLGYTRMNSTFGKLEVWDGLNWVVVGAGDVTNSPVLLNDRVISGVFVVPPSKNALSAGPVQVLSGGVVIVNQPGQTWVVV